MKFLSSSGVAQFEKNVKLNWCDHSRNLSDTTTMIFYFDTPRIDCKKKSMICLSSLRLSKTAVTNISDFSVIRLTIGAILYNYGFLIIRVNIFIYLVY